VKLDCKILDKSIWRESPEVCKVWITILAMADADGLVEAAIPGIADRARVSIKVTELALRKFQAPDKYSSNPDHEGKRIERTGRGFKVLNYDIYREFSYSSNKEAVRKRKYRGSLEGDIMGHVPFCPGHSASASASESKIDDKIERLRKENEALQRKFKSAWMEEVKFYKSKYPEHDLDFQLVNIIDWVKRKHSKAKESAKGDLNLFFQRWLNRERPQGKGSPKGHPARIMSNEDVAAMQKQRAAERLAALPGIIKEQNEYLVWLRETEANGGLDEPSIRKMNEIPGRIKELESELMELRGKNES
jgi:hypothetical protein